jgi:NhaP-type Na+/H+ or K+/H+ antiporter
MLYPPLILTSVTIDVPNWLFATNTLLGMAIGLIIGLLLGRLRRWA